MNRRAFLSTGFAVLAAPLAAEAQQRETARRVAYAITTSPVSEMAGPEPIHPAVRALLHALRELGWIEGQNLILERRSAEGRSERYADIIRELVGLKCEVIITTGPDMASEAKRVTTTVPIVMIGLSDPARSGLVASLARPGGNMTGITHDQGPEIEGKRLALLKEMLPSIKRVATLQSTAAWESSIGESQRAGALGMGITLLQFGAGPSDASSTKLGLDRALASIAQQRPDAVYIGGSNFQRRISSTSRTS